MGQALNAVSPWMQSKRSAKVIHRKKSENNTVLNALSKHPCGHVCRECTFYMIQQMLHTAWPLPYFSPHHCSKGSCSCSALGPNSPAAPRCVLSCSSPDLLTCAPLSFPFPVQMPRAPGSMTKNSPGPGSYQGTSSHHIHRR